MSLMALFTAKLNFCKNSVTASPEPCIILVNEVGPPPRFLQPDPKFLKQQHNLVQLHRHQIRFVLVSQHNTLHQAAGLWKYLYPWFSVVILSPLSLLPIMRTIQNVTQVPVFLLPYPSSLERLCYF